MADTLAHHEQVATFVQKITEYLRVPCQVQVMVGQEESSALTVSIQTSEDADLLIGKNGQNLHALEHIVRVVAARSGVGPRALVIDVNDYRKTKVDQLLQSARQAASRVRDTRKPEALLPMTSYERRIVHTELASYTDLMTESIGQDPQRRVIIKPL